MSQVAEQMEDADQKQWGFTEEELAAHPSVYRDDLLADHVVIISGGGSGLGRAMTFLFTRLGARALICGRNEQKLITTKEAIKKYLGKDIEYVAMTIRSPDEVHQLMQTAWDRFGKIDTLVNNAGGQFPQAAIDFSTKGWNAVIDTNLNGTWYMMQSLARVWREKNRPGNIVNIVANIQRGMPTVAHTCAARAGVVYLSKTVSTEWAPLNIRVNCVSPGAVETEGFHVYDQKVAENFKYSNPMKKVGDAYDVAEAVVYLSAPSGKFITGSVLTVDGGQQQWGEFWSGGVPEHFKINYD